MICRFEQGALRYELTPVDNRFLTDYLPAASGLAVKVYLYGLMQCYHPALKDTDLAEALGLAESEVIEAYTYWQQQGLVRIVSTEPLTVEYAAISQGAAREATAKKYTALIQSIQTLTAPRQFGMRELKHVYDWVELYELSEGAILTLISHCLEKRRNCSIGYMSTVAEGWALAGIHTQEEAMNYIADTDVRTHGANAILKAWHLRRPPTEDEMARYNRWTKDWGFSKEAIEQVLPRLSKSAAPSFDKLDAILEELHAEGKASAESIRQDTRESSEKRDFAKAIFALCGKKEQPTLSQTNQLAMFINDLQLPVPLIEYAAELSRGKNEPFGYLKKLLTEWHKQGIRTTEEAKRCAGLFATKSAEPDTVSVNYSNEALKQFEYDLSEGHRHEA